MAHAADLAFTFDQPSLFNQQFTEREQWLSETMIEFFTTFADKVSTLPHVLSFQAHDFPALQQGMPDAPKHGAFWGGWTPVVCAPSLCCSLSLTPFALRRWITTTSSTVRVQHRL